MRLQFTMLFGAILARLESCRNDRRTCVLEREAMTPLERRDATVGNLTEREGPDEKFTTEFQGKTQAKPKRSKPGREPSERQKLIAHYKKLIKEHRAQISGEWVDAVTGEVSRARVAPSGS